VVQWVSTNLKAKSFDEILDEIYATVIPCLVLESHCALMSFEFVCQRGFEKTKAEYRYVMRVLWDFECALRTKRNLAETFVA
jgi:hypothetical protein